MVSVVPPTATPMRVTTAIITCTEEAPGIAATTTLPAAVGLTTGATTITPGIITTITTQTNMDMVSWNL